MTIKTIALATAAFLLTANSASATRLDLSKEFCGARYCGLSSPSYIHTGYRHHAKRVHHKTHRHAKRIKIYKAKVVRVASLAPIQNEPISGLAEQAKRYLGMNARQVGVRLTLWCSAFIRKLTNASGVDDRAISWLRKQRTYLRVGAIAVMRHHVGIVTGITKNGDPILISGNHGHKVGIGRYPKERILAYVQL